MSFLFYMGITDLLFYGIVLMFATYMIIRFVLYGKKGKILFISAFYLLSVICVVARIVAIVIEMVNMSDGKRVDDASYKLAHCSDDVAFYSKVMVDIFQIGQIAELAV